MNVELGLLFIVSTCHITENDNSMLRTFSGPRDSENLPMDALKASEDEDGYFVWVGSLEDSLARSQYHIELRKAGFSEDLIHILKLANKLVCSYVRLDRDGPVYPELTKYEW